MKIILEGECLGNTCRKKWINTLWQIANQYHVDINSIIQLNQLPNPDQLVVGQTLVIPTQNPIHIVSYGESLWQIANHYGTTVQAIVRENHLQNQQLIFAGVRIYLFRKRKCHLK